MLSLNHMKLSAPAVTAKQVIHVLRELGFKEDHQRADCLVMVNKEKQARTEVPLHTRGATLRREVFFNILTKANLTLEQFLDKLKHTE